MGGLGAVAEGRRENGQSQVSDQRVRHLPVRQRVSLAEHATVNEQNGRPRGSIRSALFLMFRASPQPARDTMTVDGVRHFNRLAVNRGRHCTSSSSCCAHGRRKSLLLRAQVAAADASGDGCCRPSDSDTARPRCR